MKGGRLHSLLTGLALMAATVMAAAADAASGDSATPPIGDAASPVKEQRLAGFWRTAGDPGEAAEECRRRTTRAFDRALRRVSRRGRGAPPAAGSGPVYLRLLRLPVETLRISARGVRLDFAADDAGRWTLYTDGRSSTVDGERQGVSFAAWEDDVLYVERTSDTGTRIIEAWQRLGETLQVTYEIRHGLLEEPGTCELVLVAASGGA